MERHIYLGGTFNPVHIGHARLAYELSVALSSPLSFVPCRIPPHKPQPELEDSQRLAMLELVVKQLNDSFVAPGVVGADAQAPRFFVERCELERDQTSYTLQTLKLLRQQSPSAQINWVLGMDSLLSLDTWHEWQQLCDYANIIVAVRPGFDLQPNADIQAWLKQRLCSLRELGQSGSVALFQNQPLQVSSQAIREILARGESPLYLLPDCVRDYIQHNQLYS